MGQNGPAMLYDDNMVATRITRDLGKNLPDLDKWHKYDLTNEKELANLVAKMHHNTGCFTWNQFAKQLATAGVPRKVYNAAREHCVKCDKTRFAGSRPLSRPAAFPMANAPNEVLMLDFFHFGDDPKSVDFFHMIEEGLKAAAFKF